jgi:hypothetical protein
MSTSDRRLFKTMVPRLRWKILDYLQDQTFEKWMYIRDILVVPGLSLWDIMDTLDRDWDGMYPHAILVARASKVIDQRNKDLEAMEL